MTFGLKRRRPSRASAIRSSSMWPSASMTKRYRPSASPIGRDASSERLMPRVANCSSISSSAPGWSSGSSAMSDVLSAPVGGGGATVRLDQHEPGDRVGVVADVASEQLEVVVLEDPGRRDRGIRIARSVEEAHGAGDVARRRDVRVGGERRASSHCRHCAYATGCAETSDTSSSVVPGRATSTKSTGTRYSPTIRRPGHGRERVLRGRDAAVDRVLDRDHRGIRSALDDVRERLADVVHRSATAWPRASGTCASAASVKVPAGPR